MTIGGFEIEPKFNLGHLITILTLIVGLSMGWQAMAGQSSEQGKAISGLEAKNNAQDAAIASILATMSNDRLEQQKLLTEMRTDIRYLRRDVEAKKRAATEDEM